MPFKLIPPGARKGNPYYLVRGSVGGRSLEVSAKTKDKATAQRFARDLEKRVREDRVPVPGEAIDFAQAAALYIEFKDPGKADRRRIDRLIAAIGHLDVADIAQPTLVKAANDLYPGLAAATRNREALRPAAAILHYISPAYVPWLRVKLFREPRPKTRAVRLETAISIVNAAPEGQKRLILLWFFRQGMRIGDTLKLTWDNIDLGRQVVAWPVGKLGGEWREIPLHPEILEELSAIPLERRTGYLFRWRTKSGVYKWLRPLMRQLGVAFTPHMGRHSLGTWLNEHQAGLRTIMAALTHDDPKSSIRYQSADVEIVRAAAQRIGGFVGKTPQKAQNG